MLFKAFFASKGVPMFGWLKRKLRHRSITNSFRLQHKSLQQEYSTKMKRAGYDLEWIGDVDANILNEFAGGWFILQPMKLWVLKQTPDGQRVGMSVFAVYFAMHASPPKWRASGLIVGMAGSTSVVSEAREMLEQALRGS